MKNVVNYELAKGVCPCCGEQSLDYKAIEFEGDMGYFPYTCTNCKIEGEEWYYMDFNGHNVYDENGEMTSYEVRN